MAVQNAKNGVVRGHSRSWAMPPFDRVHTTSYLTLTETVLFSRYSQLFVESRRFWPTPPAFGAPVGVTPVEFCRDLWRQKTRLPEAHVWYLSSTKTAKGRITQTCDGQKDRHTAMASTVDAQHHETSLWHTQSTLYKYNIKQSTIQNGNNYIWCNINDIRQRHGYMWTKC